MMGNPSTATALQNTTSSLLQRRSASVEMNSGEHGAATTLYNQEGDARAAYQVLGNSLEVVMKTYVRPDVEQGRTGQAKYEQTLLKAMQQNKK